MKCRSKCINTINKTINFEKTLLSVMYSTVFDFNKIISDEV